MNVTAAEEGIARAQLKKQCLEAIDVDEVM